MYRNMVANLSKKKGSKKKGKKAGKKKGGKKKSAAKKAGKKKAKKPKAKKPKAAKKKAKKKGPSKAARKAAAKKGQATKAAKKARKKQLQAQGMGIGASIAAQQARTAKKAKRSKAAKKGAKKRAIGVELAELKKIGKGLSSADFDLLNMTRLKGVGEKALRKLAKRLRAASKAAKPAKAPKKKKGGKKKGKGKAKGKAKPAGGERRVMPGSDRVSARTAASRRAAKKKKDGCTPKEKAVRCEDRPTSSSLAACAQATRKHNIEREDRGEPKKRASTVCGKGGKMGRKGKGNAKLLAHRKAAKKKGGVTPAQAAAIQRAFMRG